MCPAPRNKYALSAVYKMKRVPLWPYAGARRFQIWPDAPGIHTKGDCKYALRSGASAWKGALFFFSSSNARIRFGPAQRNQLGMRGARTHAVRCLYRTLPQVRILISFSHKPLSGRGPAMNLFPIKGPTRISNRLLRRAIIHWVGNAELPPRDSRQRGEFLCPRRRGPRPQDFTTAIRRPRRGSCAGGLQRRPMRCAQGFPQSRIPLFG